MFRLDLPTCLRHELSNDLGYGDAVCVFRRARVPAKITHWLEMNATNPGNTLDGKIDDGPELVSIDSGNQRGHENDPQLVFHTVLYSKLLLLAERTPSQFLIDLVLQTIKLQKHTREPNSLESLRIVGLSRQTQPVGIDLDKVEPHGESKRYDFR